MEVWDERPATMGGPTKARATQEGGASAAPTKARGNREHTQEWLCHRMGLVEEDGAGFGYVGVEFVDYVGVLLLDHSAFEFHGEG